MIKFFRQIRQNLLIENKTGRYFKYALGEIILVVIGILIALQINNWNEERKANILENKALLALKNEFNQNIERFHFIMKERDSGQVVLRTYFDIITNDTIPIEKKAQANKGAYFGGNWGAQNTVLNGLVNSGAIDNIKNDSLKILLTSWPNLVQNWNSEEVKLEKLIQKMNDYKRTKIRQGIPKPLNEKKGYIYKETIEQFYSRMALIVNDLEYQNFVASEIQNLHHQSIVGGRLIRNYEQIISALNIELKNRNIN
ncbi:DUF6090 family protein [Winogradskyella sp. HB-48]|uniref:DUF6090 family protein n=1 Tax=Winogradskyella sp. HB-48 TaxID=3416808 RepID=UPI003CFB8515